MTSIRFTSLAESLPSTVPFVAPEMTERNQGITFQARLGANENNFGPSPMVQDAIQRAGLETWKYPDPSSFELRQALSEHLGIARESFVVGGGIDGLLGNLCRLFVGAGDVVVTSAGAYPTFNYHVSGFGGELELVPYKDDYEDLDALSVRARAMNAKLVYLANPDNPMGSMHKPDKIKDFIDSIPLSTLVVLDEAYIEFADQGDTSIVDPNLDRNVIRFRTFSKAYGLAGARVGYAIAHPELITSFDKVRDHFGVSKISQIAALAALKDQVYLNETLVKVSQVKVQLSEIARENGLVPLPSATNFVTMDCGRDGAYARKLLDALLEQRIFVRMPFVDPENRCIRVSVGLPNEIDAFARALPKALKSIAD